MTKRTKELAGISLKEYLSISVYDSVNECDITYDLAIGGYDDTETDYLELNEITKNIMEIILSIHWIYLM